MKLLGVLALVALAATCASAQMYVIEIGVTQDGQEQPLGESQVIQMQMTDANGADAQADPAATQALDSTQDSSLSQQSSQDVCAADVQALFNSNDCTEPVSAPLTKEQLRRMEVKRIATAVGDMLFPGLFLKMQMIRMYYQFMEAQAEPTPVALGFGDAIDKCVLKHYPKLSSPCQQAIMQAQTQAWQQYEDAPAHPMLPSKAHHRCMFGIGLLALLAASLLFSAIMGGRAAIYGSLAQRRRQIFKILRIIRTDSDLKYRIESELGSSVPKEHPSENPGCCSRLARCLIAMTFSVLIVVAGLGPLIILWGLFFWVSFVVVSCFKCCCCTSSPKEDALELMEHAAPPPHAPESEIPSGPPPAYRSGAVTGYFTLDDGSHPGVVLATRHHVFSV